MCVRLFTPDLSCRNAPEPEEMDKDMILLEKEAEVWSLKPNTSWMLITQMFESEGQCVTLFVCFSAEANAGDDH